jgi:hypothetical protein
VSAVEDRRAVRAEGDAHRLDVVDRVEAAHVHALVDEANLSTLPAVCQALTHTSVDPVGGKSSDNKPYVNVISQKREVGNSLMRYCSHKCEKDISEVIIWSTLLGGSGDIE